MIYLRPTMAYLRTANTASSLFNSKDYSGTENMLSKTLTDRFSLSDASLNFIFAEIDRQFWQNINHIEVAGTGKINQVLAKDDIENWYLKSYSNKMDEIFEAAKNLALFASGGVLSLAPENAGGLDTEKTAQALETKKKETLASIMQDFGFKIGNQLLKSSHDN